MIAKVHSMHKNLFKMYSSHTYLYLFAAKSVTVFVCGSERALWLEIYFFSLLPQIVSETGSRRSVYVLSITLLTASP